MTPEADIVADAGQAGSLEGTTPCRACPLRRLQIFRPVSESEIAFIQDHKTGERCAAAGELVIGENEAGARLFTLLDGWAFRFKTLPDGRRQILNFLLPGDLIGLQARIADAAPHGVEALTAVRLCIFSRDEIWDAYRHMPSLSYDLTWLAAREERLVDESLLSAGRRSALEGVAFLLLQLWTRGQALGLVRTGTGQSGDHMTFPLTQAHIGDALGLSSVHVNRTLQALRRQGVVEVGSGLLSGVDQDTLSALARYVPQDGTRPLY